MVFNLFILPNRNYVSFNQYYLLASILLKGPCYSVYLWNKYFYSNSAYMWESQNSFVKSAFFFYLYINI